MVVHYPSLSIGLVLTGTVHLAYAQISSSLVRLHAEAKDPPKAGKVFDSALRALITANAMAITGIFAGPGGFVVTLVVVCHVLSV